MSKQKTNHTDRDLLDIYFRAFQVQLQALRHSARWKIGHSIVSLAERFLGRKPSSLAIDHMESMIERTIHRYSDQNNLTTNESKPSDVGLFPTLTASSHQIESCAFIVSDNNWKQAIQGDVFTALELAEACENQLGWKTSLIDKKTPTPITADLTISLLFEFDTRKLKTKGITAAWVRSYAEFWIMKPWFKDFDFVLCSSKKILKFIQLACDQPAYYFPIATNPNRFASGQVNEKYVCDYSFSGNRWGEERQVEQWLDPTSIPHQFKIFGRNWDQQNKFAAAYGGQLTYQDIPHLYASTKLVIDDSNKSTFKWESVNSRVFDALGIGKPIVTNNIDGVSNLFSLEVPHYSSAKELNTEINAILDSPELYKGKFQALKEEVLSNHTYQHRAQSLAGISEFLYGVKFNIAIKISVSESHALESWGDYHFANSLSKALSFWGHNTVRIDIKDEWYTHEDQDEINIVLRGIHRYQPREHEKNILWIISHPSSVKKEELNQYDHVFVASSTHAQVLEAECSTNVTPLLQCTDPELFFPETSALFPAYDRLYIANSRSQERTAIQYAKKENISLDIIGEDWDNLVPKTWIHGQHVPNSALRFYYSNAACVINDHWPDMKSLGYISNRIFDVLACNGNLISDNIEGLDAELASHIQFYDNSKEFKSIISSDNKAAKQNTSIAAYIGKHHSFTSRASSILSVIIDLYALKRN